jgi:uncharacterized linocin/CFP29 family protein
MATKNKKTAAPLVDTVSSLVNGDSAAGRWATAQLKKAALEGKPLNSDVLRTNDTLSHEEWKYFDNVVLDEHLIRLVGVADLINAGLTKNVPNALGQTVYAYEKVTFMGEAEVTLDGRARTPNDRQEVTGLNQLPLPITHKDFNLNLRTLAASRQKGESLDTMQVRTAARVVAEMAEKMLFQGGRTFGGLTIPGYTTFADRNTGDFEGSKDWSDSSKTGESYMKDVTTALTALAADRQFGPFVIYVPTDAGIQIENDYVITGATSTPRTIRQRLEAVEQIAAIRVADQLPSTNVVFVQMTEDNVVWVQGEPAQTVQWDEAGGFELNFKVWQIAVPLIRSDAQGRSGIYHLDKA